MTDWKKTTLGQVAQVFTGFPFKSNDYSEDPHDIKLLRGDNIAQGTLRWDDAKTWPKTECEKYVQYQLKEDDVVLAMDRPWIGAGLKYSSVRKEDLPSLLVQRTARLRGSAELDIIYLKYIIASPWFSKYIQSINTGSLVPHISSKQIKDFPINLPPLPQQKKLSSVLAALDKKIDVNNFINAELEAMAKTLYDYWFVQFEFPDANGKPYKTSGGKMEYNATLKREVPAGWDIRNLGDIAELYQPKTISGNNFIEDGEYLVYGANGIIGRFDKYNHEESVVTITCRGNTCGNINVTRPYSWVTGNAMVVKPKYKYLSPYYIYNLLSISEINKVITGSAQPQITRANLAPLKVVEPAEDIMQKYSKSFDAFFKKHIAILDENDKLLKLRDWLLPLFMNGQVTIK